MSNYTSYDDWLKANPPPDLQGLAVLALADALVAGVDVPDHWTSAYSLITEEQWAQYDRELAAWEQARKLRC